MKKLIFGSLVLSLIFSAGISIADVQVGGKDVVVLTILKCEIREPEKGMIRVECLKYVLTPGGPLGLAINIKNESNITLDCRVFVNFKSRLGDIKNIADLLFGGKWKNIHIELFRIDSHEAYRIRSAKIPDEVIEIDLRVEAMFLIKKPPKLERELIESQVQFFL